MPPDLLPDSPTSAEWVTIAQLGKPRGNKGELQAVSLSDSPGRFENLSRAFLFRDDETLGEFPVEQAWWHRDMLVLKFSSVDSISAAKQLAGAEVRVPFSERAPLEAGSFYQSDLIGCELFDPSSGSSLGRVTGWQDVGGPLLMEIDGDWLVPFNRDICPNIDVDARRIEVLLPTGLRELNSR